MPSKSKKQRRFMAKVRKTSKCWIWEGATAGDRVRGRFSLDGKIILATRAAWILFRGVIPRGLFVLHKCDNPRCVRTSHLFLGTQTTNMRDCSAKGRIKNQNIGKTHCPRGHALSGLNLYQRSDRNGRGCRECRRAAAYRHTERKYAVQIQEAA